MVVKDLIAGKEAEFLSELLGNYVDLQGLGAMPKGDLDALIIHLYIKYSGMSVIDTFELSQKFRIKESRVKSLIHTGWVKFSDKSEKAVWKEIIHSLSHVSIELESLEKGQIRFKLENPGHFIYLQKEVRALGGIASYSPGSEQVVMSFDMFNKVLDRVFLETLEQSKDSVSSIRKIYVHLKNDVIGKNKIQELIEGDKRESILGQCIERASHLTSIGQFVIAAMAM